MSDEEKIDQVLAARRLRVERAGRFPLETDPLPELHPHHWEDLLGIAHIPYSADYPLYGASSQPIDPAAVKKHVP